MYDKPRANIILNNKKLKFSPKIRNKIRILILTTFILVLEVLARALRQNQANKQTNQTHPDWKGKFKLYL